MTHKPPREHFFQGLSPTGFHRVHYVEWGDPDNPKVIVCAHGLTRNGRDFDFLAQELAEYYRVVCPDMPGRGQSDWLTEKSEYSYSVYIADTAILLGRLKANQVDWVGTSMGGLIGMFVAALPNTPIRRLIINDIGPFIEERALLRIFEYVGNNPRFETLKALEDYLRKINAPFGALTDSQWAHLAEYSSRKLPSGGFGLHYDPKLGEAFKAAPAGNIDLWETWDSIRCPSLILRGMNSDLLSPDTAAKMLDRGPKSDLIEFADVGHAPALMADDQISEINEWLN